MLAVLTDVQFQVTVFYIKYRAVLVSRITIKQPEGRVRSKVQVQKKKTGPVFQHQLPKIFFQLLNVLLLPVL
jgi:hypothetical protein